MYARFDYKTKDQKRSIVTLNLQYSSCLLAFKYEFEI